jgi:hypothetical protein
VSRLRGRSSGSSRTIVDFFTSASIIADKVNPRMSDQVTCQVMYPATCKACSIGMSVIAYPVRQRRVAEIAR